MFSSNSSGPASPALRPRHSTSSDDDEDEDSASGPGGAAARPMSPLLNTSRSSRAFSPPLPIPSFFSPLASTSLRASQHLQPRSPGRHPAQASSPPSTRGYQGRPALQARSSGLGRRLSVAESEEIQRAFRAFDIDGAGVIGLRELQAVLRALQFDVREEQLLAELAEYGKDRHSQLGFDEFRELATSYYMARTEADEARRVFKLFDVDSTGRISFRNLKNAARHLQVSISDEELAGMLAEFDSGGDGALDVDDFLRIVVPGREQLDD